MSTSWLFYCFRAWSCKIDGGMAHCSCGIVHCAGINEDTIAYGTYHIIKTSTNKYLDGKAPDISVVVQGSNIDSYNCVFVIELQVRVHQEPGVGVGIDAWCIVSMVHCAGCVAHYPYLTHIKPWFCFVPNFILCCMVVETHLYTRFCVASCRRFECSTW